MKRLNRRAFLGTAAVASVGAAAAACATPTPQLVEREVTREVTRVVEKEVIVKETVLVKETVEKTELVMVKNLATVDSDRLLVLPGRPRMSDGVWGPVTGSEWRFGCQSYYMVVMPLFFMGPKGSDDPQPWLAESVGMSEDRLTLDLHLHKEAVWSDGVPVTTEDVAWTLVLCYHADADWWLDDARSIVPFVKGGQAFYDGEADAIEGIHIIDDHHMQIAFEKAPGEYQFWRTMNLMIPLPKHHLGKYTVKQLWAGEMEDAWIPETYNGPYRCVRFDEEAQYLELERNEEWWGNAIYGKPGIKRWAEQANLGLPQFLEGRCDVAKFEPADYERVKDLPDIKIHPHTWWLTGYVLNRQEGRALPRKVMDAIAYAIDRRAWAEELFFGYGQPADSIFGLGLGETASWCPDCDPELYQMRSYDPGKSRQLLAEAAAEGIWDPDRVLSILGGSDDMVLLQQQLAAVGIQGELIAGVELESEREEKGDFDIFGVSGWLVNGMSNCFYWPWECESYWPKRCRWCNEEFMTLCRDIWTAKDDAQFTEMAERIMEIYWEDGPLWGVTHAVRFFITTDALGGFIPEKSYNWIGTCGDRGIASWYWEK